MKELAIVLVSGGVDSCVTAAIANLNYELALLHLNYRQRTEERELRAFHDIADFYKVKKRLVTDVDYLRQIGGSSLTDESIEVIPARRGGSAIPATYVPFRNTHLLSIAVSWGEVIAAGKIFIGASQPDSPGYPDCRPEYYRAFNRLIEVGTRPETTLEVVTPLINLTKKEIVRRGRSWEPLCTSPGRATSETTSPAGSATAVCSESEPLRRQGSPTPSPT